MPELKTIRLYGPLRKFTKKNKGIINLSVNTTQEAIKACCTVLPGFERFLMKAKDRGLTFSVFKGKRNISVDELEFGVGDDEIRIVPIIIGSKQAGLFQTILGAVLVVAGYALSGFTGGASLALVPAGVAMMVGGIVQMLSPQQSGLASRQDPDNKPSYAFGSPVNSIAQGNPVPILYGKRRIGGAIISAGIYAEDQQ